MRIGLNFRLFVCLYDMGGNSRANGGKMSLRGDYISVTALAKTVNRKPRKPVNIQMRLQHKAFLEGQGYSFTLNEKSFELFHNGEYLTYQAWKRMPPNGVILESAVIAAWKHRKEETQ